MSKSDNKAAAHMTEAVSLFHVSYTRRVKYFSSPFSCRSDGENDAASSREISGNVGTAGIPKYPFILSDLCNCKSFPLSFALCPPGGVEPPNTKYRRSMYSGYKSTGVRVHTIVKYK